jgi:hypothetical protein
MRFSARQATSVKNDRAVYSAQDALKPRPATDWAVDQLLARPSLNLLVGDAGSKKSYLALDLAVCVALGLPWLGKPVTQSPVLVVDEEAGPPLFFSRLSAALHARQAPPAAPVHFTSLAGFDLRQPPDAQAILDLCRKRRAGLIVIDSLSGFLRGPVGDGLSAIYPVLFNLRRLAEQAAAAILLIHHTNKTGGLRGSSIISISADLVLHVQSHSGESHVNITTAKSRFFAPVSFGAEFSSPSPGQPGFLFTPAPFKDPQARTHKIAEALQALRQDLGRARDVSAAGQVLDALQSNPRTTKELLGILSGRDPGHVRNVITQLLATGLIVRADDGGQGKKAVYKLADRE